MPPKQTSVRRSRARAIPAPRPAADPGLPWIRIAQLSLCLTFFLLPVFVANWTADNWETHKLLLLLIGVSVAWFAFFMAALRRGRWSWDWYVLDWPVLGLAVTAAVGTLLSVHPWQSLVGLSGTVAGTLPATLGFVSVYFLLGQLFNGRRERRLAWASALGGVGLSLLLQLFQFSRLSLLPATWQNNPLFSTLANSPLQAALLAAVIGTAALVLWPLVRERWARLGLAALATMAWLTLLFFGQAVAWAIFAVGMMIVVLNAARTVPRGSLSVVLIAVALAAAGMVAQLTHLNRQADIPTPTEVTLDQKTTWRIGWTAVRQRPVLGSGPATWYQDFVSRRPTAFNHSPYWNSRFVRGGNAWAELLAATGLAGTGLWLALIAFGLWILWRTTNRETRFTGATAMFLLLALLLSGFLATWSLVFLALVWVGLGLARASLIPERQLAPRAIGSGGMLAFAATVIVLVGFWYSAVRVYASQMKLQQAQVAIAQTKSLSLVKADLTAAVRLDPRNIDAGVLLANAYAVEAQMKTSSSSSSDIQNLVTQAVDELRRVVAIDPTNPAVYEADNNLINALAAYRPDAVNQANRNFQTLRRLEPANPIHDVGYGQTLMLLRLQALNQSTGGVANEQASRYYEQARAAYEQARRKKSDYLQAQFAQAQADLQVERYDQALTELNALLDRAPSVAQLWSAKGTALAKLQKPDEAKAAFDRALTLDEKDTTIYGAYASALTEAGQTDQAKAVLQRGLQAVPDDQRLTEQLSRLTS